MSLYKGTNLLAGIATNTISNAHTLFDFKWTDHSISSMEWLRADTFSWQDGSVYVAAYNHLVADYNNAGVEASTSEIIAGTTIWYRLCADGHKICPPDQEQHAQDIYNSTGVSWYYILDTANQRFKLPRTKYGFTGFRDAVGKYVSESLPNIKGDFGGLNIANHGTGAFYTSSTNHNGATGNIISLGDVAMDASRSSSAYQDNAPVQQRATQMYLYFYIGQYSQSATEQTAGLNASLFNGKLDLDLGNITSTSKEAIIGLGMPDLTTQTAISTTVNQVQQANKDIFLQILPNASDTDGVKSNRVAICDSSGNNSVEVLRSYTGWDGGLSSVGIYIKKGQYFKVTNWDISGSLVKYYLVGEI